MLAKKDRRVAGMVAPAHGQSLWKVFLNVVLVEPESPPNTGNVARLCAATKTTLHLIEPFGFKLDDSQLKRAGMDYWQHVEWHPLPEKLDSLRRTKYPPMPNYGSSNPGDRRFIAKRNSRPLIISFLGAKLPASQNNCWSSTATNGCASPCSIRNRAR